MNRDAIVSVENLKVVFSSRKRVTTAIDDVTFSIPRNQTVGLVGESGCGKSTLGKSIVQIQKITSGSIRINGKDVSDLDKRELLSMRRTVQIVFQDPFGSLNPRKTIRKLLLEPLIVHNIGNSRERTEKVESIFRKVGMSPDHLDRLPHEFSGGQRQRIGIARALILEPSLVVCDEPVSALDVSVQLQVLNLLRDLQRELGLSYLFISHDLSVVRDLCDSVMVMYLGKIVEQGSSETIWNDPKHPYTRALMAAVPVPDPDAPPPTLQMLGEYQGVPDDIRSMDGCRFHPRCPNATDMCRKVEPDLKDYGTGHMAACHNPINMREPTVQSL